MVVQSVHETLKDEVISIIWSSLDVNLQHLSALIMFTFNEINISQSFDDMGVIMDLVDLKSFEISLECFLAPFEFLNADHVE